MKSIRFLTGPSLVTQAWTKYPNMATMARRPFLISFTCCVRGGGRAEEKSQDQGHQGPKPWGTMSAKNYKMTLPPIIPWYRSASPYHPLPSRRTSPTPVQ